MLNSKVALFAPAGKMAMESSIHSNRPPRCVVYTCMFGSSEHFNDFVYAGDGVDLICFTDDPDLRSDTWTIRLVSPGLLDPTRSAKRIKAMPHRFLPEYDWSLYIDNTVRLKVKPRWIFDKILARTKRPFVCFRHYARDCVYAEADRVIELGYDDPERIRAQTRFYRHLGYPENNGLRHCRLFCVATMIRNLFRSWRHGISSCYCIRFVIRFLSTRYLGTTASILDT
jgi:hypothetical protein